MDAECVVLAIRRILSRQIGMHHLLSLSVDHSFNLCCHLLDLYLTRNSRSRAGRAYPHVA